MLEEGWYLMSTADLERELARRRGLDAPPSNAVRLSIEDALARRNAGNLPDEKGRTLRLVLHVDDVSDLTGLQAKRLLFEPDFHEASAWRREGSKPVNVVPLRAPGLRGKRYDAWWDDPELAKLEEEWRSTEAVAGVRVPAAYRGFVYKTVLELHRARRSITAVSVADSIARWLPPQEAQTVREALFDANRRRDGEE